MFTTQQLEWRLPERDSLARKCARSEVFEPWIEDSAVAFDLVATWVSDGFRKSGFSLVSSWEVLSGTASRVSAVEEMDESECLHVCCRCKLAQI